MEYKIGDRVIGIPFSHRPRQLGTVTKIRTAGLINVRFDDFQYEDSVTTNIMLSEEVEPATKLAILLLGLDDEV